MRAGVLALALVTTLATDALGPLARACAQDLEALDEAEADAAAAAEGAGATAGGGEPGSPAQPGDDDVIPVRGRDQRRPVPDYDGLPDPGPRPEEVLIWIPRVLLSPLWFVSEIVLRQPIGALLTVAERERWNVLIYDFLTWDDHRAGIVPVPFYDFGQLPSIGLYFFWNDLGATGHQLRANVGFGGVDYLRAAVRDRVLLARDLELSFRVDAWRRPDRPYQGIGPATVQDDRARYRLDSLDATVDLAITPWRRSSIVMVTGVRAIGLDPNGYGDEDPSLTRAIETGALNALPPGFHDFVAYRQRIDVAIDSRDRRPGGGHGVRIDAMAEHAFDLERPLDRRWLRYAAGAAVFVDVGAERVFSLHVRATFADPLGSEPVPFTELAALGGGILDMPGYLQRAIVDRSALVATLRYRWPIWVWLDASVFVATGNVFGEHLRDLDAALFRLSWGLFLQSTGDRDAGFRLGIAFGTRAFELGGDVDSVRFVVGGTTGF